MDSGGVITGLRAPKARILAQACTNMGEPVSEEIAGRALDRVAHLQRDERELLFSDTPEFVRKAQGVLLEELGVANGKVLMDRYGALLQSKQYRTIHPDVVATLEELRREDFSLGLLSNAHPDLRRLLTYFDLWNYFHIHLISTEHQMEKPDRRFFQLATAKLGIEPNQAVHVGDDPLLDFEGAKRAGLEAILLDRGGLHAAKGVFMTVPDLYSLPEAVRGL